LIKGISALHGSFIKSGERRIARAVKRDSFAPPPMRITAE
jgi:hypothetical protein